MQNEAGGSVSAQDSMQNEEGSVGAQVNHLQAELAQLFHKAEVMPHDGAGIFKEPTSFLGRASNGILKEGPPNATVSVKTNTDVQVNVPGGGVGGAVSPGAANPGAGSQAIGSGDQLGVVMPATSKWGNPLCPCIGLDGVKGTINFGKTAEGEAKTEIVWDSEQPADYGAHCHNWPRPNHESQEPWCFVDAYNCRHSLLKSIPKRSLMFPQAKFQGKKIFYSYATCGGTDDFTEGKGNEGACTNAKTAEECGSDKFKDNCDVVEETFHESKIVCAAKELAQKDASFFQPDHGLAGGVARCRCIGFSKGQNFRTMIAKTGATDTEFTVTGETGSSCDAWDDKQHPFCTDPTKAPDQVKPDWCGAKWCYVDPCDCKGLPRGPFVTTYFREGGNYQGKSLYYSYFTCGQNEVNSYTSTKYTPRACNVQTNEADCTSDKTLNRCIWIPKPHDASQGNCFGKEIANKAFCSTPFSTPRSASSLSAVSANSSAIKGSEHP
jgi:hypothetical protein